MRKGPFRPKTVHITMNIIIVTGVPGTGKSTLAKKLSLYLGYANFSVVKYLKNPKNRAKVRAGYDRKRKSLIIDPEKLTSAMLGELKGNTILDSHLSQVLPKGKVRLCIVTHTKLAPLKRRLEKRGYSKAKVRENLDAEIFDVCGDEAREAGHKVIEFDTTGATKSDYEGILKRVKKLLKRP